ncbi:UDP-forming cellulose synthase catalytic subunit [Flavisphingomonas formosensis]|uniref:UDP-forming cellulose synthase catalytic subunit n=1 Tax=Flavisphingomonas formosensis TaxID=861534 RepID=UPI0012F9B08F|nr:UDP-forming cellulose synthase catalytic subunit [Sphingomonas formosensis]
MHALGNLVLKISMGAALILIAAFVITVPLDLKSQWMFGITTIVAVLIAGRFKSLRASLFIGIVSIIASTRYLFWRTTQTLEFGSPLEFVLGMGLYLAELYAWAILVLGLLQTSWPMRRPIVEIEGEPHEWPKVDVYVPTYNESLAIVRNTVLAAMAMDYPADRFRVYILDDGRRPEFRNFARAAGCGYLTRSDNLHAKAGNLNAAMKRTDGELIAIFDCDHVPTRAFLQMAVGWFQKDPRLALMQTPHHFYSPDPTQRNVGVIKDMPGEGDLFYGAVQMGNDLWNATFFCGSCAIIRRAALEETNGFAGETVTEDAHTALKLQRTGWNTAYLNVRLSAGLATERLSLHIGQRARWARGMTQIMRIDNPLLGPGLSLTQRFCYLNAMLHFQFPLPRIVFLTSPLAFLLFGQNIIHASAVMIFSYALPHLFASNKSSERQQGAQRRPFWGEIYETVLAFHLVMPTLMTLWDPKKGKFNVTDKGGLLEEGFFDVATLKPHLICAGLLVLGLVAGFARLLWPDVFHVQMGTLLLNTGWTLFSLMILIAAMSVGREARQLREDVRFDADLPVTLYFADGYVVDGRTVNVSMGGLAIKLPPRFEFKDRIVTDVGVETGGGLFTLPVETIAMSGDRARIKFKPLSISDQKQLVKAMMGRADSWQPELHEEGVGGFRSVFDIIRVDLSTMGAFFGSLKRGKRRNAAIAATAAAVVAAAVGLAPMGSVAHAQAAAARPPAVRPAAEQADPAAPALPGGVRQFKLSLKDLQFLNPIRLQGTSGEVGIPFGMRRDEVVTSANLVLTFAYSPSMLPDLSQLVVIMNGEVVRTIQLQRAGAGGVSLTIPVNPAFFMPGDNQLNLRLVGHYTRDCEDPLHSSLWANISNVRSFFQITTQHLPTRMDLATLPAPFFDKYNPGPLSMPFVFGAAPSNGELEASASLASWFGALASYRGYAFKPMIGAIPQGNAVVFLTAAHPIAGLPITIGGPAVGIVKNPNDPYGLLLVVMGRDERELKQAAAVVASSSGILGGQFAPVDGARVPAYGAYSAPRWLRTDRPVKLGELVDPQNLQGLGLPPGPLNASFRVAPDLFFWPRAGARLDVRYRYPAADWLDKYRSRLDVSMNGQYLQSLPLAGPGWWNRLTGGGVESHVSKSKMTLPDYVLFGQNQLSFYYDLQLANKKACEGTVPTNVRTSILPDSTIDLTGAYHATRLPNLAFFAGSGFPFTRRPDLAETAVVMAPQPSVQEIEAFLVLMGRFGDSTGAPATRVTVTRTVDASQFSGKDIIVLGPWTLAQSTALFRTAPISWQNGRLQVTERSTIDRVFDFLSPYDVDRPGDVADFLAGASGFEGFAGFQSPFDPEHSVVAILASDPVSLPDLIYGLADRKVNAQVQGDLSLVNGDGMASYHVSTGYWSAALPIWLKVGYWFSQRPLLMGISAILIALFLSGPLYLLLKAQQRKRLNKVSE